MTYPASPPNATKADRARERQRFSAALAYRSRRYCDEEHDQKNRFHSESNNENEPQVALVDFLLLASAWTRPSTGGPRWDHHIRLIKVILAVPRYLAYIASKCHPGPRKPTISISVAVLISAMSRLVGIGCFSRTLWYGGAAEGDTHDN
jgi:hypothetical protein